MLILQYPHLSVHTWMWTDPDDRSAPLIYISVGALLFVFFTHVTAGELMDCDGGCVLVCDGVSDCLRVFPACHLNRSNSVLITLPLLQSSCHCCTIYFFIYNNTSSTQKTVVSFHLREFVSILLYINVCNSSRNKWRLAVLFLFWVFFSGNFALCFKIFILYHLFPAPVHASAALAQGHAGGVSIIP